MIAIFVSCKAVPNARLVTWFTLPTVILASWLAVRTVTFVPWLALPTVIFVPWFPVPTAVIWHRSPHDWVVLLSSSSLPLSHRRCWVLAEQGITHRALHWLCGSVCWQPRALGSAPYLERLAGRVYQPETTFGLRAVDKGFLVNKMAAEEVSLSAHQLQPLNYFSTNVPQSFVLHSLTDRRPPTGPYLASPHWDRVQKCNKHGKMTEAFL